MASRLNSLSIFFPVFNESANLGELIPAAIRIGKACAREFEIIIVNDGSTDETVSIVKNFQGIYPELKLVEHAENLGYGQALRSGIVAATKEWVFWSDADLQFDLESLIDFIPYTNSYDVIIGYRKHRADSFIRRVNGELYTQLIRFLFHINIRDVDCAFKLIRRKQLEFKLTSSGAFTSAEILINLHRNKVKIRQLPVKHFPRRAGRPTGGSVKVIFKGLRDTFSYFLSSNT